MRRESRDLLDSSSKTFEMKAPASTDDSAGQTSRQTPEIERLRPKWQDLKGRPVNKSTTGGWPTAPFVFAFTSAESGGTNLIIITLVTYLVKYFHKSTSDAATTLTNNTGTTYLFTILGGFIADSYLGAFYTIVVGAVIASLGFGLLTFSVSYSTFRPPPCNPGPGIYCTPAKSRDTALLYVALYLIALGFGTLKPNISALGGDQFDDTIPKEREEGTRFFVYNYFFLQIGYLLAISGGVYLLEHGSPGWCYGAWLIFLVVSALFFCCGAMKFRHRTPTGSFLTRMAQVFVATLRKRKVGATEKGSEELYETDYPVNGMMQKLAYTHKLKILDRAAAFGSESEERDAASHPANPWTLCTVTQVEETKRILELIPVWVPMAFVGIVFNQMTTFALQMASSLDRNLGPHFTIPPPSVTGIGSIISLLFVPIYRFIVVPVARKFNNNPYGFSPLQRMGACLFFAMLSLMIAALVERKRVSVVRALHMENLVLGTFVLPMTIWWMFPIYFFYALVEFNLFISTLEFFYKEASLETHSIGTAFSWSAVSMSSFFSAIIIKLVNKYTRHEKGGSWLKGQLNNGGIEKYFWVLSVIMLVVFLVFLAVSHWYTYKYDWYHLQNLPVEDTSMDAKVPHEPAKQSTEEQSGVTSL